MTVTIKLPLPPSLNAIWRHSINRRTGKPVVYLNPKYKAWRVEADAWLTTQKPLPFIQGQFTATITLDERKRKGDADNRIKAPMDQLQRVGIITNDKFCNKITAQWGEADGCTVELVPA